MSKKRTKRGIRKVSNGNIDFSDLNENESSFEPLGRAKAPPPFDISSIDIKDFVDRLPKYDTQTFLSDIHHLKQLHFKKNNEVFKITHYQKNHQWELRAYAWKKIGKCNRYGCQYGIKDIRNKDNTESDSKESNDESNGHTHAHKKNNSMIDLNQDIPTILNNMHVVLLHGIDDDDETNGKRDKSAQELYDLLPQTPLSPHHAVGFFQNPEQSKGAHGDNADDDEKDKISDAQQLILDISVEPLSEIEWMDERHRTLCEWLRAICYRCDFFSTNANEWEVIQRKKQILSDILDYMDMSDHIWDNEQILKTIMDMVKHNLFRSLPHTFGQTLLTPDYCLDDNEEFEDPQYPHLCYVYEIALMFVRNINVDDRTRKKYLGKAFIIPLTELFASEDVREREYLKAILHGIYARNMRLRRLIRTQMSTCCWRVIHTERDLVENGVSECLQLVCSIIQGLTTPIKQEYKNILYSVLIPLHKANNRKLAKFHETLLACCIQFILKDLNIGLDILTGLMKFWPFQCANKSDMFLKEVVIIVNTMMTDIISAEHEESDEDEDEETKRRRKEKNLFKFTKRGQLVASDIINKLIECMISDNHCLAEKSLLAFGEVGVQKLIDIDKKKNWPKILFILFDNHHNKRHWCRPLDESFDEALETFTERDGEYAKEIENMYKHGNIRKQNLFKDKYNPIYPNESLFTNNKKRVHKYKQMQLMANAIKNNQNHRYSLTNIIHSKPNPPPRKKGHKKRQPSLPPSKPLPVHVPDDE